MGIINFTRSDGWKNLITGLGLQSKDKRMAAQVQWSRISREEADQAFAGDEMLRRICTLIPQDAMREGWNWIGVSKEQAEQIDSAMRKVRAKELLLETAIKARIYGGAVLFRQSQGAVDLSTPMREGETVLGYVSLSMWELFVQTTDIETNLLSPNFGYPVTYSLNLQVPEFGKNNVLIHHSRLIRMDGEWLPRDLFIRNGYWHDSTLNKLYNVVRNYETSHDSAASILQDFSVGVWKLKNLADLVASGNESQIMSRINIANYAKSVVRSIIIDADMEDYTDKGRTVAGMPELLQKVGERLVAATGIPHTILLGESPKGTNATGNSTVMAYYDSVSQWQEANLRQPLLRIARDLVPGLPESLDVEFRPLWQMDEKEIVEIRNKQAMTDAVYMEWGVIDPASVRESRFGGEKYSLETKISEGPQSIGENLE